jgi:glycosyltransferase involved in cell wall biosynthesis
MGSPQVPVAKTVQNVLEPFSSAQQPDAAVATGTARATGVPLTIWLIKAGEPLPLPGNTDRRFRTGLLVEELWSRGHRIVWWSSTVDHVRKTQLAPESVGCTVRPRLSLQLLHGPLYRRNRSWARLVNHRAIAAEFARLSARELPPDVIVCALPTVEFAMAAAEYGRRHGVPLILDIRDFWPDILVETVTTLLRPLARLALAGAYRDFKSAVRAAAAVCGVSDGAVTWALELAGRPRTTADRAFVHAYAAPPPAPGAADDAAVRMDSLDIVAGGGGFRVCYVGSMSRRVELQTVVDAARILAGAGSPIQFVLAGSGEALPDLRRQASGLDKVVFPGWLRAAEIWTLMRRSMVGLLPYPSDTDFTRSLPNKVGEYLSAGLPIVSSLQGDVMRLLSEHGCGITYRNDSPDQLAEQLTIIANDVEQVRSMSHAAAALYEDQFRADVVYGQYADLIEGVVRDGGRGVVAHQV